MFSRSLRRRAQNAAPLALVIAAALHAGEAFAQSTGGAASEAAQREARDHYARGVSLYDEEHFVAALAEFEAAYALSHVPAILFNIGQLHARLRHSVEAVDALTRYVREATAAGAPPSEERRRQVEAELQVQRGRIARIVVAVDVVGATIAVDDVDVGTTPLAAPIEVSAGEHLVEARAEGHESVRFRVRVAGSEERPLSLSLPARGPESTRVRIASTVPGVEVRIDGRSLGLTPIDLPIGVEPGPHRIEASRAGYTPFSTTVTLAAGAESEIPLVLPREPSYRSAAHVTFTVPSTTYTLHVDGEQVTEESVDLPPGLHDLRVTADDVVPVATRIDVPAEPVFRVDPGYRWTDAGRERRRQGADSQRMNGTALIVIGAGISVIGAGFVIGREFYADFERLSDRRAVGARCAQPFPSSEESYCQHYGFVPAGGETATDAEFAQRTNDIIGLYEGTGILGFSLMAGGAAVIGGGLVLVLSADSDEAIDRGIVRAGLDLHLDLAPNRIGVHGTF